jgi:hypothetical protein
LTSIIDEVGGLMRLLRHSAAEARSRAQYRRYAQGAAKHTDEQFIEAGAAIACEALVSVYLSVLRPRLIACRAQLFDVDLVTLPAALPSWFVHERAMLVSAAV